MIAGSDWAVVPSVNPWIAVETLVTRENPGGSARSFGKSQAITVPEAITLFTANAAHCLAVCRSIVERGLQFRWTAFARVDTVSRHLLHAMRRAGCTAISFGVESGSPEMLKRIRKGITLDQVVQAAQCCLDCGIEPHASFILGLPGETEATLQQTVEFGRQLQAMGVNHGFHILTPFPGTDVRDCVDRYDLEILTDDWRHYHANRAVVRTAAVGPEAMDAIVIDAERRFDTWLGEIARRRDAGEIAEAAAWPLVRLEHTVVLYHMMMQRVVEEMGAVPAIATAADDDQQAAALIERAQQSLRHPPERIRAAIAFAVRQGHLQPTRNGDQVGWAWREHRS